MMQDLVDTVRHLRRTEVIAKGRWPDYCNKYGNNTMDPELHSVAFLAEFLNARENRRNPVHNNTSGKPNPRRLDPALTGHTCGDARACACYGELAPLLSTAEQSL